MSHVDRRSLMNAALFLMLAACGGATELTHYRREVKTGSGLKLEVSMGPDGGGPAWNPVCQIRAPFKGEANQYPLSFPYSMKLHVKRSRADFAATACHTRKRWKDDAGLVVQIGDENNFLHRYGVRWYSYPACHACDCLPDPDGCDAWGRYAEQVAKHEKEYAKALRAAEPHLGARNVVIRAYLWQKRWSLITKNGAREAQLRLIGRPSQVDEQALLPESLRAYYGYVRARYTLSDSQQHRLRTAMVDAISGEAFVGIECTGLLVGTPIWNCPAF